MKQALVLLALAIALSLLQGPGATAADQAKPSRGDGRIVLALQYDFFQVEGAQVKDGSGKKRHGELQGGQVVEGRRRPALKLDGQGQLRMTQTPDRLNPAGRTLTVGALCKPASGDGVIASMGDRQYGFSLYLKEGIPHFAVRIQGELHKVAADEPVVMDQWVHLMGVIDAKGELWIVLNGWPTAHAKGKLLAQEPAETLCVGADPGSPVGEYRSPLGWNGLLEDVRLYWGVIDRNAHGEQLQEWADLPGCGCGKK